MVKADKEGLSVIGLGAFNKAEWLNGGGKDVVKNLPKLGVRVVHGNTLTAATVVHSVPPDVHEVMLVGCTSKVGSAVTTVLALKGIRVLMVTQSEERFLQVCGGAGARVLARVWYACCECVTASVVCVCACVVPDGEPGTPGDTER